MRFLAAEAGVRQFLDLGTGLPTRGNVHEAAGEAAEGTRCLYVDDDPIVLSHARALLAGSDGVDVITGDLRRPEEILAHPRLHRVLDLDRPVAVLFSSVLHCLTDEEDPWRTVRVLGGAVPSGSHLVVSHITDAEQEEAAHAGAAVYRRASSEMTLRSTAGISRFFAGFDLLEPGLVPLPDWRPATAAWPPSGRLPTWFLCGVARKP